MHPWAPAPVAAGGQVPLRGAQHQVLHDGAARPRAERTGLAGELGATLGHGLGLEGLRSAQGQALQHELDVRVDALAVHDARRPGQAGPHAGREGAHHAGGGGEDEGGGVEGHAGIVTRIIPAARGRIRRREYMRGIHPNLRRSELPRIANIIGWESE